MDIKEYIQRVEDGARYRIDFLNRKAYLNKKEVELTSEERPPKPLEIIEFLYKKYRFSYPSDRSSHHIKNYFKALSVDEMTDAQLVKGEERTLARCKLEAFILTQVLNGNLKWENETHWFWQSEKQPDLVLLKEWIA